MMIRREWTPEAADHWSKEDWVATALSVASYLLLMVGGALALLGMTSGFIMLAGAALAAGMMYYVIDPKLRAVSVDYESKQKAYVERMEQLTCWEKHE